MPQDNLKQPDRRKLIALIHVAKKQLQVSDENYRLILANVTGKESCADMTAAELDKVMERFKKLGFVAKPSKNSKGKLSPQSRHIPDHLKEQKHLIRALWITGYKHGVIRNRYEEALNRFVEGRTGVAHVDWLQDPKQATKVILALKTMLRRAGVDWDA